MSRAGHLFSRAPLSRVGDRLAQNIGHELQPKDVQNAQGCGGQTITLWEEVGRGGEGSMQGGKPRGQELLSKGGSFWTVVQSWELLGSWCLLPTGLRMSLSSSCS